MLLTWEFTRRGAPVAERRAPSSTPTSSSVPRPAAGRRVRGHPARVPCAGHDPIPIVYRANTNFAPRHIVYLSPFFIDKRPTINRECGQDGLQRTDERRDQCRARRPSVNATRVVPLCDAVVGVSVAGGLGGPMLGLVACGGGTGSGVNNGTPPPATLHDLEVALVKLLCEREASCGLLGRSQEAACKAERLADLDELRPYRAHEEGVAADRLAFNLEQANRCLDDIQRAVCDQYDAVYYRCLDSFAPQVPLGGACAIDRNCQDSWCRGGSATCLSTCQALPHGAACGEFVMKPCPRTEFCDKTARVCAPRPVVGSPCHDPFACVQGARCVGFLPGNPLSMIPATPGVCKTFAVHP